MTLGEWLTAIGASIGAGLAAFLAGRGKREPMGTPAQRQTTIPDAPPPDSHEDLVVRMRLLEAARRSEEAKQREALAAEAERAAVEALRRVMKRAAETKKNPGDPTDGRRSEDPPTDPRG